MALQTVPPCGNNVLFLNGGNARSGMPSRRVCPPSAVAAHGIHHGGMLRNGVYTYI